MPGQAERLYLKGQECLRKNKKTAAERYFLKSIENAPCFIDACIALGTLYCDNGEYQKAAAIFNKVSASCPGAVKNIILPFSNTLFLAKQYELAEQLLDQLNPGELRDTTTYRRLHRNILFAKKSAGKGTTPEPQNMGMRINSIYDEYFPSISIDDSTLVFTRKTNGIDEDFYVARRDSCGGWFIAEDMGVPPNSAEQEGAQMISADGHYLFFMRCGNRSPNGWEAGGCDLYFSYTEKGGWSQPVPFGATINTPGYEGMPALSSDNRELFFVSDRKGGYGGRDIWVSRFENGLWQIPENLGPEINTPYDETAPFIASDNKTLYFTSDGHPGFGGHDIFVSRRKEGKWQKPENMGFPLNTEFNDLSLCLGPEGDKAYFASDRTGGSGRLDLYEVSLPAERQPEPYTYIYGVVYDSLSKKRLNYAQIELRDVTTGDLVYQFQSNRGDGSYMASLPLNTGYAVHVYRPGYSDLDDTISFTQKNILYPDTLNFALLDFNYSPPLEDTLLLRIHFITNVTQVSDSISTLLQERIQPYVHREDVSFFVNGYTDDSGAPHINEELSFTRAREVARLLLSTGIPEEQLHIQGWADAFPIVPNDNEENRYINRRVEIVLRKPY